MSAAQVVTEALQAAAGCGDGAHAHGAPAQGLAHSCGTTAGAASPAFASVRSSDAVTRFPEHAAAVLAERAHGRTHAGPILGSVHQLSRLPPGDLAAYIAAHSPEAQRLLRDSARLLPGAASAACAVQSLLSAPSNDAHTDVDCPPLRTAAKAAVAAWKACLDAQRETHNFSRCMEGWLTFAQAILAAASTCCGAADGGPPAPTTPRGAQQRGPLLPPWTVLARSGDGGAATAPPAESPTRRFSQHVAAVVAAHAAGTSHPGPIMGSVHQLSGMAQQDYVSYISAHTEDAQRAFDVAVRALGAAAAAAARASRADTPVAPRNSAMRELAEASLAAWQRCLGCFDDESASSGSGERVAVLAWLNDAVARCKAMALWG